MCDKKRKVSLIGIGTGGVKEKSERRDPCKRLSDRSFTDA